MKYEQQAQRLEEILRLLSDKNTALDDAIKLFEEGKDICAKIEKTLSEVEGKIVSLTKEGEENPIE